MVKEQFYFICIYLLYSVAMNATCPWLCSSAFTVAGSFYILYRYYYMLPQHWSKEFKGASEIRIIIIFRDLEKEAHSRVIGSTWQGSLMPRLCLCLNFCAWVPSQSTLGQKNISHMLLPRSHPRHVPVWPLLLQAPVYSQYMRPRLKRAGCSSCIEPSTASHAGALISTSSHSSSFSRGWSR